MTGPLRAPPHVLELPVGLRRGRQRHSVPTLCLGLVQRGVGLSEQVPNRHIESDESGATNEFLAAPPTAEVAHGVLGCQISLNDMVDRLPRPLVDGEVLEIGGKAVRRRRVRHFDSPHVPPQLGVKHTLGGDDRHPVLRRPRHQLGDGPGVTEDDVIEAALTAEAAFRQMSCLTAATAAMRTLAELSPRTLAIMHGSSYTGDGGATLKALADAL